MYLPLWYTLFWEHERTGDPVIRPLFFKYPQDINVIDIDNQLLVGKFTEHLPLLLLLLLCTHKALSYQSILAKAYSVKNCVYNTLATPKPNKNNFEGTPSTLISIEIIALKGAL